MTDQELGRTGQVREFFDAKAGSWPGKYRPHGPLAGRLAQLASAAEYHVPPGGRVLDLGCGTGELARHLAVAGRRVVGCDISANMLGRAAAADPVGMANWIRLAPGWQTLPLAAGSFDAVIAASVLEYVDSPGAVLRECARVLRPGGVVLCTVPDLSHPVRWLEGAAGIAARVPCVRAAGARWPRLGRYLTYLQISRQRRPAGWWRGTAARAGLLTAFQPGTAPAHPPLRLLVLRRPGSRGSAS